MTSIDVEDELRWFFVSAGAELGEKGSSVAGNGGGSYGTEVTLGITDKQASAARRWRLIEAALRAIGHDLCAVLKAGYEPVSTYRVPVGIGDERRSSRRDPERVAGERLGGRDKKRRREVEARFQDARCAYLRARRDQARAARDERRELREEAAARRRARPRRIAELATEAVRSMSQAVRELLEAGGLMVGRRGCRDDADW